MSPGFSTEGVVAARLSPRQRAHGESPDVGPSFPNLLTELSSRAGVQDATTCWFVPGAGPSLIEFVSSVPAVPGEDVAAAFNAVSPGFFRLLRIPLRQGRDFSWSDDHRAQSVAIISRSLARRIFGHRDAVGQYVRILVVDSAGQSPP